MRTLPEELRALKSAVLELHREVFRAEDEYRRAVERRARVQTDFENAVDALERGWMAAASLVSSTAKDKEER